jgi:4-diphosphocytidyl-2-C-methyl-D-erythritol kinase
MISLFSPAKVNLFLKIQERRPDGFHNLCSLFQMLDFFDSLEIKMAPYDTFSCNLPHLPMNENNLVIKALKSFRKKSQISQALSIHLEKKIPQEAGLGGGSGNAATCLWGLNKLFETGYSDEELQSMGSELGSDVPVFFSTGTAYVTGRGEYVESLSPLKNMEAIVVKPEISLSTAAVFKALNPLTLEASDPQKSLELWQNGNAHFFNDLEPSSFTLAPELLKLKTNLLKAGFKTAHMTGTGSAFFCVGDSELNRFPSTVFSKRVQFINRNEGSWYEKVF